MSQEFTVLIVEDDQSLSFFIKQVLEKDGYNALTAFDGEDAVQLAKRHLPDLVILDVLIPKLTGWDVLKYIRNDKTLRSVPVIIMSNLDSAHQKHDMKLDSATEYFIKVNISKTQLLQIVEKYLPPKR